MMGAPLGATPFMTPATYEAVQYAWEQEEAAKIRAAEHALAGFEVLLSEGYKQRHFGPEANAAQHQAWKLELAEISTVHKILRESSVPAALAKYATDVKAEMVCAGSRGLGSFQR